MAWTRSRWRWARYTRQVRRRAAHHQRAPRADVPRCRGTLTKVGETQLAWIASDRGLTAAEQTGNPVVLAALLRSAAHSLVSNDRYLVSNDRYAASADVVSRATDRR